MLINVASRGPSQGPRRGRRVRERDVPRRGAGRTGPARQPAGADQRLLLRSGHGVGDAGPDGADGDPATGSRPARNQRQRHRLVGPERQPGSAGAEPEPAAQQLRGRRAAMGAHPVPGPGLRAEPGLRHQPPRRRPAGRRRRRGTGRPAPGRASGESDDIPLVRYPGLPAKWRADRL